MFVSASGEAHRAVEMKGHFQIMELNRVFL